MSGGKTRLHPILSSLNRGHHILRKRANQQNFPFTPPPSNQSPHGSRPKARAKPRTLTAPSPCNRSIKLHRLGDNTEKS